MDSLKPRPEFATPPCAFCGKPVKPRYKSMKSPQHKKITILSCCGALVCSDCHAILLHERGRCKCLFCKTTNMKRTDLISKRKTSSDLDWTKNYKAYQNLQKIFAETPGLYGFLQVSGPYDYYNGELLLEEYKKYVEFQAHTVPILSLLASIIMKRLRSKRRFMMQPLKHFTQCRMQWTFVAPCSFLSNYIKLGYPEYQLKGHLIKKCQKYLHFGSVFFITLKLSTMLLDSKFSRILNAVQLIISRFSKQIKYSGL
jgi:hypothetical protein